jgi:hypothetical protein
VLVLECQLTVMGSRSFSRLDLANRYSKTDTDTLVRNKVKFHFSLVHWLFLIAFFSNLFLLKVLNTV